MTPDERLASTDERIRRHRTADTVLRLTDAVGQPIPYATVEVRLVTHEFKFGCTGFTDFESEYADLSQAYTERYTALFNYSTLAVYWGGYESSPGETQEHYIHKLTTRCRNQNLTTKGHPLVWHEVFPAWGEKLSDAEILKQLEDRVKDIVSRFKGEINIWDVVNEATVYHEQDNAISRWMRDNGSAHCTEQVLRWAREANPSATLLYNDFNISREFESLVATLCERDAPVDVIGIQSHMHRGVWPLERVWQVCETYARYGLPLHWTEMTVLSGRLKAENDTDWHKHHTDWKSTTAGEQEQAEYVAQLYTMLFSHPAVEAITWWDFSDYATWQGAPSGFVNANMSPKPVYDRLVHLVRTAWSTDVDTNSDESGNIRLRCTFGTHHVRATDAAGCLQTGTFTLNRHAERKMDIAMS